MEREGLNGGCVETAPVVRRSVTNQGAELDRTPRTVGADQRATVRFGPTEQRSQGACPRPSLTNESDHLGGAGGWYAGAIRRTVRRRVQGIAEVRQLGARPEGRTPRPDHARLRLRSTVPIVAGAREIAAVAPRGAIAWSVTSDRACPTVSVSAVGEWRLCSRRREDRTALRGGANDIPPCAGVGATDLPGHIDGSETGAARLRAASRDAISRAVAT